MSFYYTVCARTPMDLTNGLAREALGKSASDGITKFGI